MPKTEVRGKSQDRLISQIGSAVRRTRADRRLTQGEVAELAGVSPTRVYEIEGEGANPRIGTVERVCKALGIVVRVEAA